MPSLSFGPPNLKGLLWKLPRIGTLSVWRHETAPARHPAVIPQGLMGNFGPGWQLLQEEEDQAKASASCPVMARALQTISKVPQKSWLQVGIEAMMNGHWSFGGLDVIEAIWIIIGTSEAWQALASRVVP